MRPIAMMFRPAHALSDSRRLAGVPGTAFQDLDSRRDHPARDPVNAARLVRRSVRMAYAQ